MPRIESIFLLALPASSPSRAALALPASRTASTRGNLAACAFASTRGTLPTREKTQPTLFFFLSPLSFFASGAPPSRLSLLVGADGCRGADASPPSSPSPSSSSSSSSESFAGFQLAAAAEAGEFRPLLVSISFLLEIPGSFRSTLTSSPTETKKTQALFSRPRRRGRSAAPPRPRPPSSPSPRPRARPCCSRLARRQLFPRRSRDEEETEGRGRRRDRGRRRCVGGCG